MKVSRKLFLVMAAFVAATCVIFTLITQFVVRETVNAAVESTRGEKLDAIAAPLVGYYRSNGESWAGVNSDVIVENAGRDTDLLLLSPQGGQLLLAGGDDDQLVRSLGIRRALQSDDGETIAQLYVYDPDIAMWSKLRVGFPIAVLALLIPAALLFAGICLFVAWRLSRRLTAPLLQLMPVIGRLGKGEYGVQAPLVTRDEYGQVARAFNEMSELLKNAETQRRHMVADVAHELRTPITIIRGQLDLAQHSGGPIAPESLLPLQDELIRLTRLVDDLQQLSLAEAKKLPLERKPTDLHALLQRIVDRAAPDAEQKGLGLALSCETESPAASVDPNRMTQVFLNLIVNAVRYTPEGGSIAVAIRDAGDELEVRVADTGPGIEPQHLPHLFDRFYRTDDARARISGGSGLGLAIAKGYVTAHDGTIGVESTVGEGTTFTVRLPRRLA